MCQSISTTVNYEYNSKLLVGDKTHSSLNLNRFLRLNLFNFFQLRNKIKKFKYT